MEATINQTKAPVNGTWNWSAGGRAVVSIQLPTTAPASLDASRLSEGRLAQGNRVSKGRSRESLAW